MKFNLPFPGLKSQIPKRKKNYLVGSKRNYMSDWK